MQKADTQQPIGISDNMPILQEGGEINLEDIIEIKNIEDILLDTDGSEELLIELSLPQGLEINNSSNKAWIPNQAKIDQVTGAKLYEIKYQDIDRLSLVDRGIEQTQEINLGLRLCREISNSDSSFSENTEIRIPFQRNAKPAIINVISLDKRNEDSEGWKLSEIFNIEPENNDDKVLLTLSRIPIDISFVDSNGKIVNGDKVTVPIEDLDEWRIKGNTDISGSFTIEYQAESRPNGNGGSAETLLETIEITLEPKADKPILDINEAMTPINVSNKGWIDLGSLVDSLDSSDTDGSEKLYARIEFLDLNNRLVDLKDGAMLSTQFSSARMKVG